MECEHRYYLHIFYRAMHPYGMQLCISHYGIQLCIPHYHTIACNVGKRGKIGKILQNCYKSRDYNSLRKDKTVIRADFSANDHNISVERNDFTIDIISNIVVINVQRRCNHLKYRCDQRPKML